MLRSLRPWSVHPVAGRPSVVETTRRRLLGMLLLLPCLLLVAGGCSTDTSPQAPVLPEGHADKARHGSTDWAGRARPFAQGLRVHDLAATPTRLFATTLDNDEKLVTLDEWGHPGTFTFLFTAAPEQRCAVEVSPGWNPALPADEVWLSRGRELLRLSPQGDVLTPVATLPAADGAIAGMCFDHVGTFGHALVILSETGAVFSLESAQGTLERIGSLTPGGRGPSVASASFGTHAGHLLVSYPDEDVVRALGPAGLVSYVVGWSGVSAAATVPEIVREFGRSQGAYFVALEDGTIHRFEKADIGPLAGDVLVSSLYRSGSGIVEPQGVGYSMRGFSRSWGAEVAAAFVQRPAVTGIEVVVLPGMAQPSFQQGSTTSVPVALLSSSWFWPNLIDIGNVTLAGAAPVLTGKSGGGLWSDLNQDGILDLTLTFCPAEMQVGVGMVQLHLVGQTMHPEAFEGSAQVTVTSP